MYNSGSEQKPQALEKTQMIQEHNSHRVTKSDSYHWLPKTHTLVEVV
jgi:hypothetical protein